MRRLRCVWSYFFAVAFRRSAQYFFIRADTAFFAAADIGFRRRVPVPVARSAPLLMMKDTGSSSLSTASRRCGKVFTSDATSAWSSCQRASAPRRAHLRMSAECFAIA